MRKLTFLTFLLFSLVGTNSYADENRVLRSLQDAIAKGALILQQSSTEIVSKALTGLVLVDSSVGQFLMLTNVSKLTIEQGTITLPAGGCFMFAKFSGFRGGDPIFDLVRVACIDDKGYAHEYARETQPFLGKVLPPTRRASIEIGNENGKKAIESGTDVSIKLHKEL
jgi:hypothetical protein